MGWRAVIHLDRLKREDAHAGAASEQWTRHPVRTIMALKPSGNVIVILI